MYSLIGFRFVIIAVYFKECINYLDRAAWRFSAQHFTARCYAKLQKKIRMHRITSIWCNTCLTAVRWSCSWWLW